MNYHKSAVLFADISSFTTLSETVDAEDVAAIVNALWARLDAAILDDGGRIDKHIGDTVPSARPDHPLHVPALLWATMTNLLPAPHLETLDLYRVRFASVAYWEPYVQAVCDRHGYTPRASIRSSIPGTYPVFIVEDHWVIKFYGQLFNGATTFAVEQQANRIVAADGVIPVPQLLDSGALFGQDAGEWHWPYLVFAFVPGINMSAIREQVSFEDQRATALQHAAIARRLHGLSVSSDGPLQMSWDAYAALLAQGRSGCTERQRAWGSLPPHLVEQIDDYLPPLEALIDRARPPRLLHADCTADHAMGTWDGRHWQMQHLIDFGDAIVGDPAYELIPLHLDLFGYDKRLLRAYLDSYGDTVDRRTLARKAMSLALLHPCNVLYLLPNRLRDPTAVPTLDALATAIWDTSEP
jgi:hygromycin-B 7''-O-kinase